ncbi:MAG: hypothetical protein MMC33_002588 [Icmadophila ericetorum]|nr:hypothetical protein [Icmadophila ericetorum]
MSKKRSSEGISPEGQTNHLKKMKLEAEVCVSSFISTHSSSTDTFLNQESSIDHFHQSHQGYGKTPETRIALLGQLLSEIAQDKQNSSRYSQLIGGDSLAVALNLGQVFRSRQSMSSSLATIIPFAVDNAQPSSSMSNSRSHKSNRPALPDLPKILDPALVQVPFTHQGVLNGDRATAVHASYERLEFVGDAYIELVATRLVYHKYPQLPAGRLSQFRELLVKNETLSTFSLAYKFDERARIPQSHKTGQSDRKKQWIKMLGDIFEAYVAAVILSNPANGFTVVEKWLTELWLPVLDNHMEDLPLDLMAKQDLARKVLGKGVKIDYRELNPPKMVKNEGKTWYTIGVFVTGWGWESEFLGQGSGLSQKDAGARAAMQALLNPTTAQIGTAKRDYDAKVKLEREQQSGELVNGETKAQI